VIIAQYFHDLIEVDASVLAGWAEMQIQDFLERSAPLLAAEPLDKPERESLLGIARFLSGLRTAPCGSENNQRNRPVRHDQRCKRRCGRSLFGEWTK
jgi:hypothetical protein